MSIIILLSVAGRLFGWKRHAFVPEYPVYSVRAVTPVARELLGGLIAGLLQKTKGLLSGLLGGNDE